jgi:hypothetical protein
MLIACPGCNRQLNVPEQSAGQRVRCPLCQVEFQAPAAASAPTPPAPAPAAPSPARGPDGPARDDDFEDEPPGRGRARNALSRGAVHLLVCAIVFTAMLVLTTVLDLVLAGMDAFRPPGYMVSFYFLLIFRLVFLATPIIFLFVGSSLLRQARGRGVVMTACILTIVLAGLCTIGVLVQLIRLTEVNRLYGHHASTALVLSGLSLLLVLGATVYGYIAGISTLMLLGRPEVKEAYGLYVPRRPRRYRYDERREPYDEERW